MHDGGGRACDLARDFKVETNPHERFVEPGLVDFGRVGNMLDRRDQIVATACTNEEAN